MSQHTFWPLNNFAHNAFLLLSTNSKICQRKRWTTMKKSSCGNGRTKKTIEIWNPSCFRLKLVFFAGKFHFRAVENVFQTNINNNRKTNQLTFWKDLRLDTHTHTRQLKNLSQNLLLSLLVLFASSASLNGTNTIWMLIRFGVPCIYNNYVMLKKFMPNWCIFCACMSPASTFSHMLSISCLFSVNRLLSAANWSVEMMSAVLWRCLFNQRDESKACSPYTEPHHEYPLFFTVLCVCHFVFPPPHISVCVCISPLK